MAPSGWQAGIPAAILGRKMEFAFRFDRYRRSFLSARTAGTGKTSWTQALFRNARRIDPLAPHHLAQSLGLRAFQKDCPVATSTVRSSSTA